MKKITKKQYKYFDDIKHIDENGMEFWYARELAEVLEYVEWRNVELCQKICQLQKRL